MKQTSFATCVSIALTLCLAACGSRSNTDASLVVDGAESIEISIAMGGAPTPCPSAYASPIAYDYVIDFGASTLHVETTPACAAAGATKATRDVSLRAADRDALFVLANDLVLERTSACGEDGSTTVLTVHSQSATKQYPVDDQGGECTIGATALAPAQFEAFFNRMLALSN